MFQVASFDVLTDGMELSFPSDETTGTTDMESATGSSPTAGWGNSCSTGARNVTVRVEHLLIESKAHHTLVRACAEQLLGGYKRLDNNLRSDAYRSPGLLLCPFIDR